MIEHRFSFPDEHKARIFVEKLIDDYRVKVAICRSGGLVIVLDGEDPPQTERILRAAKSSDATWAKWSPEGSAGT